MRTLLLSLLSLAALGISAQQRDERVRDYLPPVRIVWMQGDISGQDNLLEPSDGQSEISSRHLCRMKSSQGQQPAILLDFGREIHGGIRLVTGMPASQKPVNVRIRLGESVAEAMSEPGGKTNAGNDHAMRDFPMQLPWLGIAEVGNSGFRFVRIDLLDPDAELILREVNACFIYRDLPYLGSFRCSDPLLNQIWNTGAYTVHLNMQNYLWDGIKRDRLVWVGDLHPEVTTVATVFGPHSIVPRSLDLARQTTPLPGWMNDIGSYSLWWILIQRDWYRYYADLDYLNEQKEYLSGLLKQVLSTLDKNGREHLGGGMRFLDWPSNENPDAIDAGLQSLTVMALQAGSELCRLLGDQELAQQCDLAQKKALKEAQKLGRSFLKNHDGSRKGDKQAAALLVLCGAVPPQDVVEVLTHNGAANFSTFYGYYMLEALAMAGEYQQAMDLLGTYWGGMLELGATTFWEDFDLAWMENAARIDSLVPEGKTDVHGQYGAYCYVGFRHSLCHGWASGPTSWLSRHVLGFYPADAETLVIEPHLGSLEWAEGSFPTAKGVVKVRHDKGPDGRVNTSVKALEGLKIIVKKPTEL